MRDFEAYYSPLYDQHGYDETEFHVLDDFRKSPVTGKAEKPALKDVHA